jgi:LAS superfamily LD-carboxypeptidase LdcB
VWPPLATAITQLVAAAARAGIPAQVTSGVRTYSQQARLYRRYLAGMNPYPVAPPGTSDHELGLAVDIWAGNDANTIAVGNAWARAGGVWSTRDIVHFTVRKV